MLLQFLLLKRSRNDAPFSLSSQNSEYPRIFQVMGANQNMRKLLSTDLVYTNKSYSCKIVLGNMNERYFEKSKNLYEKVFKLLNLLKSNWKSVLF